MRAVGFHRLVKLFGERPLTPVASEIIQRAPDRLHLVDHFWAAVAKVISQNPQSLYARQRLLDWNLVGCQQTVQSAMSPMRGASVAPRPGSDHAGGPNCQASEPTVAQKMNPLRETQPRPLSHFLILTPSRHGGQTPQHPSLGHKEHVVDSMELFARAANSLPFAPMLASWQAPLGSVDNQIFALWVFAKQLVQISGLPGGPMQRNQLRCCRRLLAHPLADLTFRNSEEQPQNMLGRLRFEKQRDDEQLLLGADQAPFAPPHPNAAAVQRQPPSWQRGPGPSLRQNSRAVRQMRIPTGWWLSASGDPSASRAPVKSCAAFYQKTLTYYKSPLVFIMQNVFRHSLYALTITT